MRPKLYPLLAGLLTLSALALPAQSIDWSKFKSLSMRSIGPAGMSGRVTVVAGSNEPEPTLYAGTASGGLWRSNNQGGSWQPVFDKEAILSIGAVAVAPGNASVVWAGTGEGNPRNSQNSGKGIYRSQDAGRSWQCMGLTGTKAIHRIVIDPRDERVVYAAALGSAWGPGADRGVFKTTDAGETWQKVLYIDDSTGCADLVMDPSNPNKLIAAMWHYHREPWFFTSGGKGSGMHMTLDGGRTWRRLDDKSGLPAGQLGRMGLAISASRPNVVYALVEAKTNGLYRSDDGGFTWAKRSETNIGNRPFYYAELYVDPTNENRLYNLHTTVTLSEDGGKTFSNFVGWDGAHPDHHAWWIDPRNPDFLVDGNDGGLAYSRDRGKTWTFAPGLPVGQFYHVDHDMARPYNVMGGLQDNGSWVGPSEVWAEGGIRNHHWREVLFGDGFDVAPYRADSAWVYAMSQGGALTRVHNETGQTISIRPVHPDQVFLRFNWNSALAVDPFVPAGVYYGSQFLHYSPDGGDSWQLLSPDLTTDDSTKQRQAKSGGLTLDATAAENYTTIVAIAPSPLERGLVWVGTDDGNLQVTRDGGKTWENVAGRLPGAPKGGYIAQVVASTINPGEAFVVVNDYRRNNWEAYAYHTRDFGKTWRRIVDGRQVPAHCLSIAQDHVEEHLLFLGTDQGLYVSVDAGANWTQYNRNFPAVPVSDLKVHPRDGDLIVATFGRALWVMDDIGPLRALTRSGAAMLQRPFFMLPAQPAVAAEYRSVDGSRFPGVSDFEGRNPPRGASIVVYVRQDGKQNDEGQPKGEQNKKGGVNEGQNKKGGVNEEQNKKGGVNEGQNKKGGVNEEQNKKGGVNEGQNKKGGVNEGQNKKGGVNEEQNKKGGVNEGQNKKGGVNEGQNKKEEQKENVATDATAKKPEEKKGDIKLWILDMAGDTVRHLTATPDTGFQRIAWRLDCDGVHFPQYQKPRNEYPGGWRVVPGTYKAVAQYGGMKDSTRVEVLPDPRVKFSQDALAQWAAALGRYRAAARGATQAFDQLREARASLDRLDKLLDNMADAPRDSLRKLGKPLRDTVKVLMEVYLDPEDLKGLEHYTLQLGDRYDLALGYLDPLGPAPGPNGLLALAHFEAAAGRAVARIRRFIDLDWADYRKRMEQAGVPLLKTLRLE